MSLLFIDGFDTYGASDSEDVYGPMAEAGYIMDAGFNATPNPSVYADTRTGIGFSLCPINWTYGGNVKRAFPTCSGVVIGVAVKMLVSDYSPFLAVLYNNLVGGLFNQLILFANGENGITAVVGNNEHFYFSPPNVLFPNVWQYVELKYSPGTGTSALEVRVDGVAVISVTNEALLASGAAALCNLVDLPGPGRGNNYVDDLYICSTDGANFNDFLGDCVVHSLIPVSDGGTNTMTQVGGVSGQHFSNVDDIPPDDDTSYLSSNTSGQKELFNLSTISADVLQVLAVSVNTTARKEAPGLGIYKSCIVTGGTEADGPSVPTSIEYIQSHFTLETQPNAAPWTNSALQSSKIGFKLP